MIRSKPLKFKNILYDKLHLTNPERDKEYSILSTAESVKPTIAEEEEFEEEEDEEYEEVEKALGFETEILDF